jgi:hypothetical protein
VETGVFPKNMQKQLDGGQYAISPIWTTDIPFSFFDLTGMGKYISSPHVFTMALIGSLP